MYIYKLYISLSAQDATGARGRAVEHATLLTPTVISEKSRVRRSPPPPLLYQSAPVDHMCC